MNQDSLNVILNTKALGYSIMILARLPSFVSTRMSVKTNLYPGTHWHWSSCISKLSAIALLYVLSGHVCDNLESRRTHESYLQHNSNI